MSSEHIDLDTLFSLEERAIEIPELDSRHIRGLWLQYEQGLINLNEYRDTLNRVAEIMDTTDQMNRMARDVWTKFDAIPNNILKKLEV